MNEILATLIKYILGIIGIGTIVILHELGHFIVAHFCKIDVEIFSLGFGPKLYSKQIGKTEYRISAILFGGYCRLKGADDLNRALDANSKSFEYLEQGSLFSVHPLKRALTYLAGPVSNVIISILLSALLLSLNSKTLSTPAFVITVNDYPSLFNNSTSPAYESGIRSGDIILEIDGQKISDYQQFSDTLNNNKNEFLMFTVQRDEKVLNILVAGEKGATEKYRFGLTNLIEPRISSVRILSPEHKAGLQKNDVILKINNTEIHNNLDILKAINSIENEIDMELERAGEVIDISYSPIRNNGKVKNNFSLYSPTKEIKGLPLSQSLKEGSFMAFNILFDTVNNLIKVLSGKANDVRQVLTGPMRASLMIGDIAIMGFESSLKSGFRALCYLLAIVSISIAIANLLPLPAFDGGQIIIAIAEIITTKRISPKKYWICQLIGMGGLVLIFVAMYFIDLRYFYHLHFG